MTTWLQVLYTTPATDRNTRSHAPSRKELEVSCSAPVPLQLTNFDLIQAFRRALSTLSRTFKVECPQQTRTAGPDMKARFPSCCHTKLLSYRFPSTGASKQTPHTGEHNIGAPDVIQPSPSSENQGWGCSNERATGTACGSYPRAKQSKGNLAVYDRLNLPPLLPSPGGPAAITTNIHQTKARSTNRCTTAAVVDIASPEAQAGQVPVSKPEVPGRGLACNSTKGVKTGATSWTR